MYISEIFKQLVPSGTVAFSTSIQELRDAGRDVIDLAVGEPEFAVDPSVMDATRQALDSGFTRYGPVAGLPALRTKLAAEFEGYNARNILIANGAKQGLFEIFQVICDKGREVVIPAPCWVSFEHQVKISGGVPVTVDTVAHQLDVDAIEHALTDRTVAILVNSPNNPTGAVYDRTSLGRIVDLCLQHNLWLVSDEAYASFVYGDKTFVSPFEFPDIRQRLIVVRSFSKTYAMTGFRVGYLAASEEMIARCATIQGHLTGNVCSFAQHGAAAAANLPREVLEERNAIYEKRRDLAVGLCRELFEVVEPDGAFYLFPSIRAYRERFGDDIDLARHLLENANVAVVPGAFFRAPGHIRISFAARAEQIRAGFKRLKDAL
ncbi:MAG: pyridoxal phosphate-dependent aminotransferase [Desulfobacterales bacterium]|jgi:aspartate aminotransferase